MKPTPLKWRIALLVTVVLAAVITTISAVAYHEMAESLEGNANRTLQAMANAILEEFADAQTPQEFEADVRMIMASPSQWGASHYRVWPDDGGNELAASGAPDDADHRWVRQPPQAKRPERGKARFFDLPHRGEGFRVIWTRQPTPKGTVNILVALSTTSALHEMGQFLRMLLILGAGMLAGSVVVGTLIVLVAMRPIGRTAARLHRVTHRNLGSEHLSDLRVPAELEPFLASVRELLARLDRAMQRQKQFTSDASHELRTPLSLAKSTLQVARSKERTLDEYQRAIDEALGDLRRMERLIRQMLVLARLDEGKAMVQATELQLDALLYEQVRAFDAKASQAGGKVVCDGLPLTRVYGDEGELTQLFGNLLENAIDHGPSAGTVTVTLEHGPNGDCTVCVHDEGGGIPPDALPHLFDRFYRADSSRNHATGGTGLGLAIAREIARRHGGDVTVQSDPASGTRACIRLPRR